MPRRKPAPLTVDQIRRETSRLHAAKGAVLRDIKAATAAVKPKPKPRRRASSPAPAGIRMGK